MAVHRNLSRALCLLLVLSLFSSSTPAAPQLLAGVATERSQDLGFWFYSSGWNSTLRKMVADPLNMVMPQQGGGQETQAQRDALVTHLQIYPGDVTLEVGQHVIFAGVATDAGGAPVSGVQVAWSALDAGTKSAASIRQSGDFPALIAGTFTVTAQAAGQTAHVTVTVNDNSGSSSDGSAQSLPDNGGDPGANDDNYWSVQNPRNRIGNPPGMAPAAVTAGNGNFQIAAPVIALPGRGLNLTLGLTYNSRLWNKANNQMTYDLDRGWPAPGWSLGFGKIIGMGVDNGSMMIDADGTRHSFTGTVNHCNPDNCTHFIGKTTDGTFIDYSVDTGLNGYLTDAQAQLPNGTFIQYGASGGTNINNTGLYPTQITDANGNYISITYVNNTGPRIQTITDTLGRTVAFSYDANNLLTAITGPDLNGGARTLVRLHYQQQTLNYAFNGLTTSVRNPTPWLVDAIYYPATNTGYEFSDTDSYSSYGMIRKVSERRGMSLTASSLTEQGTISSIGSETQQTLYNYTAGPDSTLADAPTYTSETETWAGMTTGAAVTTYAVQQDATPRSVTITLPDGTQSVQLSYNHAGQYDDGLVFQDQTKDSNGNPLQTSATQWEQGDYNAPRPKNISVTDELNQTTGTEFSYGTHYNQVIEARKYDYGYTPSGGSNTLLNKTVTAYENGSNYLNRHIFNLVTFVEVYEIKNTTTTRVSRTDYQYDDNGNDSYLVRRGATPIKHHNQAFNPDAPPEEHCWFAANSGDPFGNPVRQCDDPPCCETVDVYNPNTVYRGNVTQVKTYSDAANLTGAITEDRTYDITGNLITATTACCQQMSFNYTSATQYAYPASQTRGSATDAAQQVTTSAIYNVSTGLVTSSTDANGRTTSTDYDSVTLRPQTITLQSGAVTTYGYDDAAMTVTEITRLSAGTTAPIAAQSFRQLNGRGQVSTEKALAAAADTTNNIPDVWDYVDTEYDVLGRVKKQSRPYRSGETPQWTTSTYDALGRISKVEAPDGSTTEASFNEAARPDAALPNTPPGQTMRVKDAWGRERWGRTDALGHLVEVVEPKKDGNGSVSTGGSLTTYSYDTLGHLTGVSQGDQSRSFLYDSLGRLLAQKLAEANGTLDMNGGYTGGGWSDVFTYDDRSNMTSHTDARGVKATFSYDVGTSPNIHSDPLNRLQSVTYTVNATHDTSADILPAPTVSYEYMTTGDLARVKKVTTAGVSVEDNDYTDTEGRLYQKTVTLTGRESYPMVTRYLYDSLDRATDVYYPSQYGAASTTGKHLQHDYDVASRLSGLKVDSVSYASGIVYNAASQITALNIGPSSGSNQLSESYHYDPVMGLLDNQKVQRGSSGGQTTLMDFDYDYLRTPTTSGRTGQLTKIKNNLNQDKDRSYTYDALGRLLTAQGGPVTGTALWTQTYSYDRYGNRTNVTASGNTAASDTAKLELPKEPKAALPNTELAANTEPVLPDALRDPSSRMLSDSPARAWSLPLAMKATASSSNNALADSSGNFKPLVPKPEPQSGNPSLIISEFRLRGPNGPADEFIEFYNNSNSKITVSTSDTSSGWALVSSDAPSTAKFVIPNGTEIPARGHYLAAGSAYNLQGTANADQTFSTEILDNSGIALFQSANSANWTQANELDAVGFTSVSDSLFREGAGLTPLSVVNAQYSLIRNQLNYTPQETNDNASDFMVVSTTGCVGTLSGTTCTGTSTPLGAPGPENLRSPIAHDADINAALLDPLVARSGSPNLVRVQRTGCPTCNDASSLNGTLSIRRTIINQTGFPVTRLRFRVIDITTLNYTSGFTPPATPADMRVISSEAFNVMDSLGSQITVQGTQLEQPVQPNGGGLNSTLVEGTTTLTHPLANGASVSVQWLLGVMRAGSYRFLVSIEAVATGATAVGPPVPRDGFSGTATTDGSPVLAYDTTNNHITTAGFLYDAMGNQTQVVRPDGTIEKLRYDAAGRLVKVMIPVPNQPDRVVETTTYGASSQRLIVQAGDANSTSRTYYAWSGDEVLAEYIDSSSSTLQWAKSYIYLGARLLATMQPTQYSTDYVEYHHPDRLGTRLITNASNSYLIEQATLPYGVALDAESTGASNRRFTSYERSAQTGLDYAVNRHYDAVQGRFTQVDPIGAGASSLSDPQSLNLYAYCGNDPINRIDPDGLFSLKKAFGFLGKVFKGLLIAAAVTVAVLAVLAGTWGLGAAAVIKLAAISGGLFAMAFGPPIVRQVLGIAASAYSIYQQGTGIISNFANTGIASAGSGSNLLAGVAAVGAIANFQSSRKKRPGDYQTITDAAIAALRIYNILSIRSNQELAGSLCEYPDGRIIYTPPNSSTSTASTSTPTPCPTGTQRVGTYHTHAAEDPSLVNSSGDGNEIFSPADRRNANRRSIESGNIVPNFVATPSGTIRRFDPAVIPNSVRGRVTTLRSRTPIP
jgi:RHS repeat-associated protein